MPDTAPSATSPAPAAPAAQTSDAKQGASNLSASALAQRFLEPKPSQPAEAEQTKAAATPAAPEPPAAETEQTTAPAEAETKPNEPAENETAGQEGKEEADDVLSQQTLDPKTKARLQKRFDKLTARAKQAEARLAEVESKLTGQPQQPETKPQSAPLPTSATLPNIETIQDLAALQQQAKEAARWAEEMLDHEGVEQGLQVGDRVFTKADLKGILRNAKRTMEDDIPARANFLQRRHAAQQEAYTEFPFLKDKTSEEYQMAQAFYARRPWMRNDPEADGLIGLIIKGWKAHNSEKEAAKKAKEAPKPKAELPKPPVSQTAVSAGSSVRAPAGDGKDVSVAYERLKTKGGVSGSEFAAFLAQADRTRNSR